MEALSGLTAGPAPQGERQTGEPQNQAPGLGCLPDLLPRIRPPRPSHIHAGPGCTQPTWVCFPPRRPAVGLAKAWAHGEGRAPPRHLCETLNVRARSSWSSDPLSGPSLQRGPRQGRDLLREKSRSPHTQANAGSTNMSPPFVSPPPPEGAVLTEAKSVLQFSPGPRPLSD